MFDSPFEFCSICRGYVLLDQTQRECAREHRCADAAACPLRRIFTGIDFTRPNAAAKRPDNRQPDPASAPGRPAARRRKT